MKKYVQELHVVNCGLTLSVFFPGAPGKPPKNPSWHLQIHSVSHWFRLWSVGLAAGSTRKGENMLQEMFRWSMVVGQWHVNISWDMLRMGLVKIGNKKQQLWLRHQNGINFEYVQILGWSWQYCKFEMILLMEEISNNHLECIKPCKKIVYLPYQLVNRRISASTPVRTLKWLVWWWISLILWGDSPAGCLAGATKVDDLTSRTKNTKQLSSDQFTLVIYVVYRGLYPTQSYRDYNKPI